MKLILIILCFLMSFFCYGQSSRKDAFQTFKTLEDVLAKAKATNKKIFIDAYATWCGPCKLMDENVFTSEQIAGILSENFISVKIQMDKTEQDSENIKDWYEDADRLIKKYSIESFPAFIFLNSDGALIQMENGYQEVSGFLALLKKVTDVESGYTKKLSYYTQGKLPSSELLALAVLAKKYDGDSLAYEIARMYKKTFFDKQKVVDVLKPGVADAMVINFYPLLSFKDSLVQSLYYSPNLVDSAYKEGIARQWLEFFLVRDIVDPILLPFRQEDKHGDPNWSEIHNSIARRFDSTTAQRVTLNQQISFYHSKRDWENAVKYEIDKIESYGLDTVGLGSVMLNNLIFNVIFKHSKNPIYLKKAIGYMRTLLKIDPNKEAWIDTYANLLYKMGKKQEALTQQRKAIYLAKKAGNDEYVKEFLETLNKMESGKPTWK